jgi:phytoene dehydrogenase-like protein
MGSLTAAALLAKEGLSIRIIEQNWIPGGCTSSYPRKNFVFETGATTLVGMDEGMSLRHLVDQTGIKIPLRRLETPMKVYFDGALITRFNNIDSWIEEAEKHFDGDQRGFWESCYQTSQFVWDSSLKYKDFPPRSAKDFLGLALAASLEDLWPARHAFRSTEQVMKKYGVFNEKFLRFVDQQLMITAQNSSREVNFLFGAAALCYTNYGNYYVDGGLINLVNPIISYIESKGGHITYREPVTSIEKTNMGYRVTSKNQTYTSTYIVSGIPINNTVELLNAVSTNVSKYRILDSKQLNSAFQMGIAFKSTKKFDCLHHQIHVKDGLHGLQSGSIFVSLSHPDDHTRTPEKDQMIASISTHIPDPASNFIDEDKIAAHIQQILIQHGFLEESDILYTHTSGPKSWQKWTGRKWGFVGGYPQFLSTKPWQMLDVRLNAHGAYQVGDTVYPGQGIPGVTLGGIIAAHKLLSDIGKKPRRYPTD